MIAIVNDVHTIDYTTNNRLCTLHVAGRRLAWDCVQALMSNPRVDAILYPACIDPDFDPASISQFPMFV